MLNPRWPDAWKGPYWEPHAIWCGISWTRETTQVAKHERYDVFTVYVCLVPCFQIRMTWVDNA